MEASTIAREFLRGTEQLLRDSEALKKSSSPDGDLENLTFKAYQERQFREKLSKLEEWKKQFNPEDLLKGLSQK